MDGMRRIFLIVPLVALGAAGAGALAADGCSPSACVPETGKWSAPSPQKLTSAFGPTALTLKVTYRRGGKAVRSKYGNTVSDLRVYLRYFCEDPSAPWVETGFAAEGPIRLGRDGTAKVTIPKNYAFEEHTLRLKFKRDTFSGRLSGSETSSTGAVCTTSVSFSGRAKG
jgi:hypothetical protein